MQQRVGARHLSRRKSIELARGNTDRAAVEASILRVLRSRGGRLSKQDLSFELRLRGRNVDDLSAWLDELVMLGLVRGPISRALVYELTTPGWDMSQPRRELDIAASDEPQGNDRIEAETAQRRRRHLS
jgi:hypothetical protein